MNREQERLPRILAGIGVGLSVAGAWRFGSWVAACSALLAVAFILLALPGTGKEPSDG